MLVLDDAGVRSLAVRVVDDGDALVVLFVEDLGLEFEAAVLEFAEPVSEVLIDGAGVDTVVRHPEPLLSVVEEVRIEDDIGAVQHPLDHGGVPFARDALVAVVEVVVVIGEADRQALDDEGRKLRAVSSPLFLRVAFDQFGVDGTADEADGLLFEVLRLAGDLRPLLVEDFHGLGRRGDVEHLREGVHVEGHVVHLALVVGDRGVDEVVELRKLVHIVPDVLVRGVEDVRAVLVDVDAFDLFRVDVAGDVVPFLQNEDRKARLHCLMGKHGSEQAGADHQIIVMLSHVDSPLSFISLPGLPPCGLLFLRDRVPPECG